MLRRPGDRFSVSLLAIIALLTGCQADSPSAPASGMMAVAPQALDPSLEGIYGMGTRGDVQGAGCSASAYRDFSFWVGDWNITPPGAPLPGTPSRITSELDGCVVMETYAGGWGRSLNLYDRRLDRWRHCSRRLPFSQPGFPRVGLHASTRSGYSMRSRRLPAKPLSVALNVGSEVCERVYRQRKTGRRWLRRHE